MNFLHLCICQEFHAEKPLKEYFFSVFKCIFTRYRYISQFLARKLIHIAIFADRSQWCYFYWISTSYKNNCQSLIIANCNKHACYHRSSCTLQNITSYLCLHLILHRSCYLWSNSFSPNVQWGMPVRMILTIRGTHICSEIVDLFQNYLIIGKIYFIFF